MKKLLVTLAVCMIATVYSFAQYTTNFYDQYGTNTGYLTHHPKYGGKTTTYYDEQRRCIGTSNKY